MLPELVLPYSFPLNTENTVPKSAVNMPKNIPSLYRSSILKITAMQATITIPIITSEISIFLLKTIGSRIEVNRVESDRKYNAMYTIETYIERKKHNQWSAMKPTTAKKPKRT